MDQVILITGSTDGLGKLVASHLADQGATILLHGRNECKGVKVLEDLQNQSGNQSHRYFNADFSSLEQVNGLAGDIIADYKHIDILINNAGIGGGPRTQPQRELSEDGIELRFAVNYLSTYLLTRRLLPVLKKRGTRIVNVSSVGQEHIDFNNVMFEHDYEGLKAYRQSKLAMIMFTFDLADELKDTGVTVNALHPASLMDTKMVMEYFGKAMTSVEEGAKAVEYLALSSELDNVTGQYFDGMKKSKALPQAYDKEARRKLRELSEKLVATNVPHI